MRENLIKLLHDLRNQLQYLQGKSHKRILNPEDFDPIIKTTAQAWQICMSCTKGEGEPDE